MTGLNRTQKDILEYIKNQTKGFQKLSAETFTAALLARELNISRNSASQYLNEFAKKGVFIKTASRPVYFFSREVLEDEYHIRIEKDIFTNLDELNKYLRSIVSKKKNFAKMIGYDAGLSYEISQCRMAINYPPHGLPLLFCGAEGTGKSTLAKLSYEYAVDQGLLDPNNSRFVLFACRTYANDSEQAKRILFGDSEDTGLMFSESPDFLYIKDIHFLSKELQDRIAMRITNQRIFFSTTLTNFESFSRILLEKIPVIVRMPTLENRSQAEKEQLIASFYKKESLRTHHQILISRRVREILLNSPYEGNIRQMKSSIQTSCVNAFQQGNKQEKLLRIQTIHLPEKLLRQVPFAEDSRDFTGQNRRDPEFLDIDQMNKRVNTDREQILYCDFLKNYNQIGKRNGSFDNMLKKDLEIASNYFDYMVFEKNYSNEKIRTIEQVLVRLFQEVNSRYDTSLSPNFALVLSRVIYNRIQMVNTDIMGNEQEIKPLEEALKEEYIREYGIMEEISGLILKNLEFSMTILERFLLFLKLYQEQDRVHGLNTRVLIVCHGYSTASSIADVTNQIYGKRIFDAIDMPMDTKTPIIVAQIEKYLETALDGNVIIMVDLGSLETIDSMLNTRFHGTLGIINNVSTHLALNVGKHILSQMPLPELLEKAKEENIISYRIIEKKEKEEAILFVSELGSDVAQKVSQLFLRSIPKKMEIHLLCYDCEELQMIKHSVLSQYNILFCAGMIDPILFDIPFVYLEDIISFKQIETVKNYLSAYLNETELQQFHRNLLKNFSLQNVIEYLTILNADKVLEFVDETLEQLQVALSRRFSAKTIIGLNIHISCLVERLVKKAPITSHLDEELFMETQKEFIDTVRICFKNITDHYSVTLPISEIHYIYDYIYHD